MIYFIPAWYSPDRWWADPNTKWYRQQEVTFDDTISQVRLFKKHRDNLRLLILNYQPALRYFLHRYDIYEVSVWSAFDMIQDIMDVHPKTLAIEDLSWPEGIEFFYTPFLVTAFRNNIKFANIEFGLEGQIIFIEQFIEGEIAQKLYFDDRGFLSSIVVYQNHTPLYQDYLNLNGDWQIRENLLEGDVLVNPEFSSRFRKSHYESMEELIEESLENYYIRQMHNNIDFVLAAATNVHINIISNQFRNDKLVWSFFEERLSLDNKERLSSVLANASLILTDKISTQKKLSSYSVTTVQQVSLYDSRLSLGKSREMKSQIIYLRLDELDDEQIINTLLVTFELMRENASVLLKMVFYEKDANKKDYLTILINQLLEKQNEPELSLAHQTEGILENNEDGSTVNVDNRVELLFLQSEVDILNQIETARLVVDLSVDPDVYTQIAAISAGIPQLNRVETEYVSHLKNGFIVDSDISLSKAYHYYLDTLVNWNHALIYAVKKIGNYTSEEIVRKIESKVQGEYDD